MEMFQCETRKRRQLKENVNRCCDCQTKSLLVDQHRSPDGSVTSDKHQRSIMYVSESWN